MDDGDSLAVAASIHRALLFAAAGSSRGIHGDADLILPIKPLKPPHVIKGGTHLMIVNRAAEISVIINEALKDIK